MEVSYKFTAHIYCTSEENCLCSNQDCKKHIITYVLDSSEFAKITNPSMLIMIFNANISFIQKSPSVSSLSFSPHFVVVKEGDKYIPERAEHFMHIVSQEIVTSLNLNINNLYNRG